MAPSLYLVRMPEIEPDEPMLIGRRLVVIALDERMEAEDAPALSGAAFDVEFQLCDIDLEDVCIDIDCHPALIVADEPLAIAA